MKLISKSFLKSKLLQKMEKSNLLFIGELQKYPFHDRQIYQGGIKETQFTQTYIVQN